MKIVLETERLILREFNLTDVQFIIQLLNSEGWIKFIGDRNIKTEEQAKEYLLNGPIKSYHENGFGLSLVELKSNSESIGMCGLIKREGLDHPDIGFAFLPEFSGKGYAVEIAKEVMNYAKKELKLSCVMAITLPNNTTSIKLLKKIGLNFDKIFSFPNSTEELLLFIVENELL